MNSEIDLIFVQFSNNYQLERQSSCGFFFFFFLTWEKSKARNKSRNKSIDCVLCQLNKRNWMAGGSLVQNQVFSSPLLRLFSVVFIFFFFSSPFFFFFLLEFWSFVIFHIVAEAHQRTIFLSILKVVLYLFYYLTLLI